MAKLGEECKPQLSSFIYSSPIVKAEALELLSQIEV